MRLLKTCLDETVSTVLDRANWITDAYDNDPVGDYDVLNNPYIRSGRSSRETRRMNYDLPDGYITRFMDKINNLTILS